MTKTVKFPVHFSRDIAGPLVVAVFFGFCGNALARPLSDDEASRLSLEELLAVEVYSTDRYVRQVSGRAAAASVVTAEDIRTFGYRSLADILRAMPGLYVANDRNYSYLGSRGLGSVGDWNSRVLVLVDGFRVNENLYDGAYIGQDFIVDVGLIERVEYVAGPAAAMLHGNNAIFGVVNVVTRSGRQLEGGELGVGTGSADTRQGRVSYGRLLDNGLEFLLSASRFRSDGRDLPLPEFGGTARGLDFENADRVFAKLGWGEFQLEIAHAERDKGIPNASYGQVFNDPRSRTVDIQSFVDLKYSHALDRESAVSGRLYFGRYEYLGDYVYDRAAVPPPDIAVFRDTGRGEWWGGEAKYVSGDLGGHKLLLGADFHIDLHRDMWGRYLDQPMMLDSRKSGRQWGVFVHDEIALGPDLTLDLGARYDHPARGDGELHPRIGLAYQWRPDTALKALYSSAFRPPNVYELYYVTDDIYYPNPRLDPERVRTVELGIDHRLSPRDHLVATLFRNDVGDKIDYVAQDGPDGLPGTVDDFLQFQNAYKLRNRGLELRYERTLADGRGRLAASYTGQRTRDDAGNEPGNSPRHLAKLQWRQPLFATRWQAGLELQYVGSRRTYAGSRVGGVALTNLSLHAPRLLQDVELTVSAYNLFDRRYSDPAAGYHDPLDRIRQDGRTWLLQARFRF